MSVEQELEQLRWRVRRLERILEVLCPRFYQLVKESEVLRCS